MRIIIKLLVLTSFLLSANTAFAQAEISMSRSINLTAEEASSRVFHVKMPRHGVLVLNIVGNDRFSTVMEPSDSTRSGISSSMDGKTAFIQTRRVGNYSVGASTVCGLAISVVISTYEKSNEESASIEDNLPKVVIEAPEACAL